MLPKLPVNEAINEVVEFIEKNTKEPITEIKIISKVGVVATLKMEDLDGSFTLREASLLTLK